MKQLNFIKKFICLTFCAVILAVLQPTDISADEKKTIKVGFFAFDGYHMQDENKNRSGYGYDILEYIASYGNLKLEYTGYEMNWNEAQDQLEAGAIDLLTSAQKTDERLEKFDYSDLPLGTSATILTVRAGNTQYILNDYAGWDKIRVGMLNGNSRNESFATFAVNHEFTYSPVYYDNTEDLLNALKNGSEIDAAVTSNLRRTDDEWILAKFDLSPFYAIVKKGNTELLTEINRALEAIYKVVPNLNDMLMHKYYTTENSNKTALSPEEDAAVKASKTSPVKVGIMLSGAPSCYQNKHTGEYIGIAMDVLRSISNKTGLMFEYVPVPSQVSPINEMQAGNLDIASMIFKTQKTLDADFLLKSDDLTIDSVSVVGRKNEDFTSNASEKTIAISSSFVTGQQYVKEYFPDHKMVLYNSVEDCMDAVKSKKADAAIHLYNRSAYLLLDPHYEKLCIIPSHGMELPACCVGLKGKDEALIGIINKGLDMISDAEHNSIMLKYTVLNTYQLSFSNMIYKFRQPLGVILIMFLIIIVAGILLLYMRKKNMLKLQEAYEHTQNALLQAEHANTAKSQFLSRVSHEMRTPLNAIIGFLTLAKDAEQNDMQTYLTNSNIAAKQLLAVINDVLDMSAIDAGKMSLTSAPFDFKRMIQSITNVFLPQCEQKNISFELKLLTPIDEWLIGDQLRVNQILFNLLSNAVKFTDRGHVFLTLSQNESKEGLILMRFEITDTGCGMSEEMLERLFKPFEQENSLTAAKYGGSGLGLSIVKNLINMMNGVIAVKSAPEQGTTFNVDIPFIRSEAEMDLELPDESRNLKVLAVDDESIELSYLEVLLTRIGVRHSCVSTGEAAIKELAAGKATNDPYQLCLIDWKMPNMDGIETTRLIREKFGKNVLVIVISAYEYNQAHETAKQAGANLFIPKPLFQSSLFDIFMTLTGGKIGKRSKEISQENADFTGMRVLMAEDNAMNRMVAQAIIKKFSIECECVEDGQLAVEKFLASPHGYYDAILMDIQMPNMNGLDATKCIRESAHPQAATIQIIALTADAFNVDIAKALSAGMNAHVSKPIDPNELINALKNAFRSKEQQKRS